MPCARSQAVSAPRGLISVGAARFAAPPVRPQPDPGIWGFLSTGGPSDVIASARFQQEGEVMAVLDDQNVVVAEVREGTYGDAVATVEPGGAEFIPLSERHGV